MNDTQIETAARGHGWRSLREVGCQGAERLLRCATALRVTLALAAAGEAVVREGALPADHAAGGDDRAAVSAWRAAVVADPALIPGYLAQIDAYIRLGQPDLALLVARTGQQALPSSAELRDRVLRLERR